MNSDFDVTVRLTTIGGMRTEFRTGVTTFVVATVVMDIDLTVRRSSVVTNYVSRTSRTIGVVVLIVNRLLSSPVRLAVPTMVLSELLMLAMSRTLLAARRLLLNVLVACLCLMKWWVRRQVLSSLMKRVMPVLLRNVTMGPEKLFRLVKVLKVTTSSGMTTGSMEISRDGWCLGLMALLVVLLLVRVLENRLLPLVPY